MMLKRLKIYASNWLGVTELKIQIDQLKHELELLKEQSDEVVEVKVHGGASVEAKGRVDYEPVQTGNVVVAEPKILSVERGRR